MAGWLAAATYATQVAEPHEYRGVLARMDRAVMMVTPEEALVTPATRSALIRTKIPGAVVCRIGDHTALDAVCVKLLEAGYMRRAFTDALDAFLWVRREAHAAPGRKLAPRDAMHPRSIA